MTGMTHSDWFEDGSFEDALAHFEAMIPANTVGPVAEVPFFVMPIGGNMAGPRSGVQRHVPLAGAVVAGRRSGELIA